MVEQNCSVPYDFRCISDHDIEGVEVVPFSREIKMTEDHHSQIQNSPHMWMNEGKPQGCWAKVDAWLAPLGTFNLILDLDICIISDLAQLIREEPSGARDGRHTEDKPWLNGSVISWKSTEHTQAVYPTKIPYKAYPRGEQEYVQKALGGFSPLPGVYSYKCHLSGHHRHKLPSDTVIVFFHGQPTPAHDEVQQYAFVGRTWKGIERIERI